MIIVIVKDMVKILGKRGDKGERENINDNWIEFFFRWEKKINVYVEFILR